MTAAYHNRRGGAKSFVDDLVSSQGVVLSRADVLLRSIETKPRDSQICSLQTNTSREMAGQVSAARPPPTSCLRAGKRPSSSLFGYSVCQLAK